MTSAPTTPAAPHITDYRVPITFLDCIVVGVGLGLFTALGYGAGYRAADPVPIVQTKTKIEFLTQPVWAPQCAPGYRGQAVRHMPAPPMYDDYGTAETSDRPAIRRPGDYIEPRGKSHYERAQDAREAKYYRDLLSPSKKGN